MRKGRLPQGHVRLDTLYSGFSAGTELTFLKDTNPYLLRRWDERARRFRRRRAERALSRSVSWLHGGRRGSPKAGPMASSRGDVVALNLWPQVRPHRRSLPRTARARCPTASIRSSASSSRRWARSPPMASCMRMRKIFGPDVRRLGEGVAGRPVVVVRRRHGRVADRAVRAEARARKWSSPNRPLGAGDKAEELGLTAMTEDQAWQHAKARWHHGGQDRGADFVFQTRARSESLHDALRALRPQGTVIDLAFYQGGADRHAAWRRVSPQRALHPLRPDRPRAARSGASWDRRRLSAETLALLGRHGDAIRREMITHVVPIDEAPAFLSRSDRLIVPNSSRSCSASSNDSESPPPIRILFVFAWLVVGGEETEVRLLARNARSAAVIALMWSPASASRACRTKRIGNWKRSASMSIASPYRSVLRGYGRLSREQDAGYDIVVSCQNVADIYPALEKLHWRPPLDRAWRAGVGSAGRPEAFHQPLCRRLPLDPRRRRVEDAGARTPRRRNTVNGRSGRIRDRAIADAVRGSLGVRDDAICWSAGWAGWMPRSASRISSRPPRSSTRGCRMSASSWLAGQTPSCPTMPRRLQAAGHRARSRRHADVPRRPRRRACSACRRWMSSSGCRAAKACRMSSPRRARPACRSSRPPTTARCSRSNTASPACSCRMNRRRMSPQRSSAWPATRRCARGWAHALRAKVETTYAAEVVVPQWQALFDDVLGERSQRPRRQVFAQLHSGRLRMLDSQTARRAPPRPAGGHRTRHQRRARLRAARARTALTHGPRRPALASDREAATAITTGRASCRCCAPRGVAHRRSSGT